MADKEVRLIDAKLLTTNIAQIAKNCAKSDAQKALIGRILYMIENMPTIEVEPVKHGRWKITENVLSYEGTFDFIGCSKCGKGFLNDLCENNGADFVNVENDFLFCPFCGSKNRMDGESDDEP